jgi:hypothetical protein
MLKIFGGDPWPVSAITPQFESQFTSRLRKIRTAYEATFIQTRPNKICSYMRMNLQAKTLLLLERGEQK